MKRKILRVGWVGVRGYGERFWRQINGGKDFVVTACMHPDTRTAEQASRRMRCRAYTDPRDFFYSVEFDAVALMVPNEFHYSYAKRALQAGKHVFVEKPMTNTYAQARALVRYAEEQKRVLMVGHNYRYNGFVARMKQEIRKGRIGKVVAAEFNMSHGGGLKFGPGKWRFHREKCPGGPLNMLGSHLIDTANYFFGTVKRSQGIVKRMYARTTAEDTSMVFLEYQSGVVVSITNLYNSVSTEYATIYGTDGALRFQRWPETRLWFQPKDKDCRCSSYEELDFKEVNTAQALWGRFVAACRSGKIDRDNRYDGLEVVRIMEGVM